MDFKPGQDIWDPNLIARSEPVELEGVPMHELTVENWGLLWAFAARPDDLLISTYPKAGSRARSRAATLGWGTPDLLGVGPGLEERWDFNRI